MPVRTKTTPRLVQKGNAGPHPSKNGGDDVDNNIHNNEDEKEEDNGAKAANAAKAGQSVTHEEGFFAKNASASLLGCLLLHENPNTEDDEDQKERFNAHLTLRVNFRQGLVQERFWGHASEDQKKNNLLYQLVMSKSGSNNPLGEGRIKLVVASFQQAEDPHDDDDPTTLSLVFGNNSERLRAVPATKKIISEALKWLEPQKETNVVVPTDKPLLWKQFVESLQNAGVPNGNFKVLRKFVDDREWVGEKLWGGSKEDILRRVDAAGDKMDKWRMLRRFIVFNFARQTKLCCFPVDGMHRCALSANVYNGLPSPGIDDNLTEMLRQFWKQLRPAEEGDRLFKLRIKSTSDGNVDASSTSFDPEVNIGFVIPDEITKAFLSRMREESVRSQAAAGCNLEHDMLNMLLTFLETTPRMYLQGKSGGEPRGVEKVLRGFGEEDKSAAFKSVLTEDYLLCDEAEAEDYVKKIKDEDKNKELPHEGKLAVWYCYIWMEKWTKKAFDQFKSFAREYPQVGLEANLRGIMDAMDLQQFRRLFKSHTGVKYPKEDEPESWRWDPGQIITASVRRVKQTFFGDPYQKPWKSGGSRKNTRFPAVMCDFVWLVWYANLTPETCDSILQFTKGMSMPAADVLRLGTDGTLNHFKTRLGKEQARKCCRCLVLTIHSTFHHSNYYWKHGYFDREGDLPQKRKARHMGRFVQGLHVLISSIIHCCEFHGRVGYFPTIPMPQEDSNSFSEEETDLLRDPPVGYSYFFHLQNTKDYDENCAHFKSLNVKNRDHTLHKEHLLKKLTPSVLNDLGLEAGGVEGSSLQHWLPMYSVQGEDSFSMAPKNKTKGLGGYSNLVVVLGFGDVNAEKSVTHRLYEFACSVQIDWRAHKNGGRGQDDKARRESAKNKDGDGDDNNSGGDDPSAGEGGGRKGAPSESDDDDAKDVGDDKQKDSDSLEDGGGSKDDRPPARKKRALGNSNGGPPARKKRALPEEASIKPRTIGTAFLSDEIGLHKSLEAICGCFGPVNGSDSDSGNKADDASDDGLDEATKNLFYLSEQLQKKNFTIEALAAKIYEDFQGTEDIKDLFRKLIKVFFEGTLSKRKEKIKIEKQGRLEASKSLVDLRNRPINHGRRSRGKDWMIVSGRGGGKTFKLVKKKRGKKSANNGQVKTAKATSQADGDSDTSEDVGAKTTLPARGKQAAKGKHKRMRSQDDTTDPDAAEENDGSLPKDQDVEGYSEESRRAEVPAPVQEKKQLDDKSGDSPKDDGEESSSSKNDANGTPSGVEDEDGRDESSLQTAVRTGFEMSRQRKRRTLSSTYRKAPPPAEGDTSAFEDGKDNMDPDIAVGDNNNIANVFEEGHGQNLDPGIAAGESANGNGIVINNIQYIDSMLGPGGISLSANNSLAGSDEDELIEFMQQSILKDVQD